MTAAAKWRARKSRKRRRNRAKAARSFRKRAPRRRPTPTRGRRRITGGADHHHTKKKKKKKIHHDDDDELGRTQDDSPLLNSKNVFGEMRFVDEYLEKADNNGIFGQGTIGCGLQNVVNSCWMNTLLHYFYLIPEFRLAILHFRVEKAALLQESDDDENILDNIAPLVRMQRIQRGTNAKYLEFLILAKMKKLFFLFATQQCGDILNEDLEILRNAFMLRFGEDAINSQQDSSEKVQSLLVDTTYFKLRNIHLFQFVISLSEVRSHFITQPKNDGRLGLELDGMEVKEWEAKHKGDLKKTRWYIDRIETSFRENGIHLPARPEKLKNDSKTKDNMSRLHALEDIIVSAIPNIDLMKRNIHDFRQDSRSLTYIDLNFGSNDNKLSIQEFLKMSLIVDNDTKHVHIKDPPPGNIISPYENCFRRCFSEAITQQISTISGEVRKYIFLNINRDGGRIEREISDFFKLYVNYNNGAETMTAEYDMIGLTLKSGTSANAGHYEFLRRDDEDPDVFYRWSDKDLTRFQRTSPASSAYRTTKSSSLPLIGDNIVEAYKDMLTCSRTFVYQLSKPPPLLRNVEFVFTPSAPSSEEAARQQEEALRQQEAHQQRLLLEQQEREAAARLLLEQQEREERLLLEQQEAAARLLLEQQEREVAAAAAAAAARQREKEQQQRLLLEQRERDEQDTARLLREQQERDEREAARLLLEQQQRDEEEAARQRLLIAQQEREEREAAEALQQQLLLEQQQQQREAEIARQQAEEAAAAAGQQEENMDVSPNLMKFWIAVGKGHLVSDNNLRLLMNDNPNLESSIRMYLDFQRVTEISDAEFDDIRSGKRSSRSTNPNPANYEHHGSKKKKPGK